MSQTFRRAKARRALGVDTSETALAANRSTIDEDLSIKGLISHGLAALAISTLGLAVAGSVALTSSAQAMETTTDSAQSSLSTGDHTQAQPAAQAQRPQDNSTAPANQKADKHSSDDAVDGALDVFARTADSSNRNAVRAAIDGAVADQKAKDRGVKLDESDEKAAANSAMTTADARSTELNNATQANKREQARMAEEKKKADEALKGQQDANAGQDAGNLPAAAPLPVGAGGGVVGGAASPIAPGQYTLGARWGAVGSWARWHTGQDLPAPIGTPIRAAAAGVVMGPAAGASWAGNHIVIRHADGTQTLYAHMSVALVHTGEMVQAGQQIGNVGITGRSFGPHLHFEHYPVGARPGDVYSTDDPYSWMLRSGVRL